MAATTARLAGTFGFAPTSLAPAGRRSAAEPVGVARLFPRPRADRGVREDTCVDLSVLFLGTAGSMPTVQRAPASLLIRRGGDRILIDCGEGSQRQLLRSVGLPDLEHVFLTHYHADHFLGLPGMLKTFALRGRFRPVTVYGPRGLGALMSDLRRIYGKLSYELNIRELGPSDTVEFAEFRIGAYAVVHRTEALGYALVEHGRPGRLDPERAAELGVPPGPLLGALQRGEPVEVEGRRVLPRDVMGEARPGRKLVFSGDSEPCKTTAAVAEGAELLVHDGTFAAEERERARQTGHSTALEAAQLAREANVSLLALTHLSSRYFGSTIEQEARTVFERTVVPRDFDVIEVPYRERGKPALVRWRDIRSRAAADRPASETTAPATEASRAPAP
jgi:ribonuclease Z